MVDPESIRRRLGEIGRRLEALHQIRGEGLAPYRLPPSSGSRASRSVAIQAAIDVASHIVAEDSSTTPDDYGSTFLLLGRIGAIDDALSERLRLAAGLRNVIVHGYLEVDVDQLWKGLDRLDDLEAFASSVERYLAD